MAGQWTFGRIGLTTAAGGDGLELSGHYAMDFAGDEVRVEADLDAGSVADQRILRDQFRGYDLSDEAVVPVTSAQDPTVDGFYRVAGLSVVDTTGTHFTGGIGSHVTAELERIASPLVEVRCNGTDRGAGAVTTGDFWAFVPFLNGYCTNTAATATAAAAGFSGGYFTDATAGPYSAVAYYTATPAAYYTAAVRLEATADAGVTWRTVIGQHTSASAETGWRITSELLQVSVTSSGQISVGWNGGTAASPSWETTLFALTYDTPTDWAEVSSVTVLANRPEMCSVRLGITDTVNYAGAFCDLTVRRGANFVEGHLANMRAVTETHGIRRTASEAATSVTGGIEATSADANGNKFTLLSPSTITKTTAGQSGIRLTSAAQRFPFAVSPVNTALVSGVTLTEAYFSGIRHRQRVIAG